MKVQYLGTGASEGLPCLFCSCPVCSEALELGDRNVRRRASMLVENDLLIDITPDLWSSGLAFTLSLSRHKYILITHEHREHFYFQELRNFFPPYAKQRESTGLTLFGNRHVQKLIEEGLTSAQSEVITFQLVKPFVPFSFGEYTITPLNARHCDGALIYLIEKDGKTLLYGNDSGFLPEETWDFLAGRPIHLISLDCNNPVNKDTVNHMNFEDTLTVRRRLYQIGCTTPKTKFFISHISHNGGLGHAQLEERILLHGIHAAYDGLALEL